MNRNLLFIAIISILLNGCSDKTEVQKNTISELYLTEAQKQIVSIDTVQACELRDELTLTARITFNREEVARIYPIFGGTVKEVNTQTGAYVKKGDVLAVIRSGEAAEYEKIFKEAEQQVLTSRRNLSAIEDMYKSGMASERDLLSAKQEHVNALADEKRINELFSIYQLAGNSLYTIKSPITGFVMDKNINNEMQLRSDQTDEIFTISGLDNVWVLADIYESDISKVKEGDHARIVTLAYPDESFTGTVDKVYNMLDEESKTLRARINLPNPGYKLKPGMFANVYLKGRATGIQMPCINTHAVIFENGNNYIIVVKENDQVEKREIQIHTQSGENTYISEGLKEGEYILNSNTLLVYNAINDKN